jgi:hypothetical protein
MFGTHSAYQNQKSIGRLQVKELSSLGDLVRKQLASKHRPGSHGPPEYLKPFPWRARVVQFAAGTTQVGFTLTDFDFRACEKQTPRDPNVHCGRN